MLIDTLKQLTVEAKEAETSFLGEGYANQVRYVCRFMRNRAPIRFLLSCCAAKIDKPDIDIRKPYTVISGKDTFSGRFYDERYIQQIIDEYNLPCNATTAYLTPAFRNRNTEMTAETVLVGSSPELYETALRLLNACRDGEFSERELYQEINYQLFLLKAEEDERIRQLLHNLEGTKAAQPLSSEQIITLIQQHLASKNASRLPVLIVAAAYRAVESSIGETIKVLQSHNAADSQTGALGDVEIILANEENVVTCYEMKNKRVTKADVIIAVKKISTCSRKMDNYIFITTDIIDAEVIEYASALYEDLGTEIAILDCIGFIRHFLHFFHRRRTDFLDYYQALVLSEPNSSVDQALKEVFLALRQAAEIN